MTEGNEDRDRNQCSKNDPAGRERFGIFGARHASSNTAEDEDPDRGTGLRGEESIAALCRREGIAEGLYYSWSKEFLEAGKKRLAGDTGLAKRPRARLKACARRCATLKELVAELSLENRLLKKNMIGHGGGEE